MQSFGPLRGTRWGGATRLHGVAEKKAAHINRILIAPADTLFAFAEPHTQYVINEHQYPSREYACAL